jgi:hypothetical protein
MFTRQTGWRRAWFGSPQDGATRQFVSRGVDRNAKIVPPQDGATRKFAGPPGWCHPSVCLLRGRPGSPNQCHPSVRSAVRMVPPVNPAPRCAKMGPPFGSGTSDRAIFGATPQSAGVPNSATPQSSGQWPLGTTLNPRGRVSMPACQDGATRWFVSSRVDREDQNRASLRFGVTPGRGHPPVRARQPGAKMVPPVGSVGPKQCHSPVFLTIGANTSWCHPSVCRTLGATPQSGWTEVASSILASPPRVAPVRPLWSIPSRHPTPLTVLAGAPERKASRLKKLFSPTR